MKAINLKIKKGRLARDKTIIPKTNSFLRKARNALMTLNFLSELNTNKKIKSLLKIPNNYNSYEWIVITSYYAMYTSALALLAKIGFRSKDHTATLLVLEEYFVKKKILDQESFSLIKNALFQKQELEKLSDARHKREIAQYSITKQTTKDIADKIKKDAYDFVNKVELILIQK